MKRREILKLGAAAPAALPILGQAQQTARAAWKPKAFNAHQNETVVALAELIIPATDTPGAKAALVNRHIDLLLADGPETERERFLSGLAWLDDYAVRNYGSPFIKTSAVEQVAILETLDANRNSGVPAGNQFFRMLKSMTSRIYYNTEIGYKELNKGGRPPKSFGCKHPEHA